MNDGFPFVDNHACKHYLIPISGKKLNIFREFLREGCYLTRCMSGLYVILTLEHPHLYGHKRFKIISSRNCDPALLGERYPSPSSSVKWDRFIENNGRRDIASD